MTKDRMNLRHALKHAHGAVTMEDSIGITQLRSSAAHMEKGGAQHEERSSRLVGLMKWSFDDLVVKELLPLDTLTNFSKPLEENQSAERNTSKAFIIPLISEGVPDIALASLIKGKCSRASVTFLTPLDFGCCQERLVLVYGSSETVCRSFRQDHQIMHTTEGLVIAGKAISLPWLRASPPPVSILPELCYSVLLRGLRGSLADVLPRLERLGAHGFLNYSHMARHGVGLYRAFECGRYLLHRDYKEFLCSYVKMLTERSPLLHKELPPLLEIIGDPKSTRQEWSSVRHGLEYALKQDASIVRRPQTGLYYPHHDLLRDFLERASNLAPRSHDSAQVIRESIARLVLQEQLRSVADVHFNAFTSLRWEMYGDKVVVGDLVIVDKDPLDLFDAPADHVNGVISSSWYPEWLTLHGDAHLDALLKRVRLVQTPEEAKKFTIEDVVLPVMGTGVDRLLLPRSKIGEAWERLGLELQVEGLPHMKAAPPATYRRMIAQPKNMAYCVFDDGKGWSWESHNDAPIKPQLYKDQEGIIRQPSPLYIATGKNVIARRGIHGAERRSHFLKPARREGMTCVLSMTLPRSTALTSALREVFQFGTLDPAAIFRLLR